MTAARAGRSKVAFSHACVALLVGQLDQQGEREDLIRHLSLHHVSSGYLALFCGGSGLLELYEPQGTSPYQNSDCIALTRGSPKATLKGSMGRSHTGHEYRESCPLGATHVTVSMMM